MKKILLCICVYLFFSGSTFAATRSSQKIPGITCGLAGEITDNKDSCCYVQATTLPRPPSWVQAVPLLGHHARIWREQVEQMEEIQREVGDYPCYVGEASLPTDLSNPNCKCINPSASASATVRQFCTKYIKSGSEVVKCIDCANRGIYTGMGCIPLSISDFIGKFILGWGIGFAGGIALLCIIYSAFRMQTSMGNPEIVKKAQENLTACITGLILIIFSVFILRLIGVSILRIPFLN